ncbi:uncharacterized protein LOC142624237 [Castanea sativa]|uniref:uncharacterized protein LOC142624237 n=1 Tax=Castanea sativa TaxID=21020 RepID=UPI003F65076B
MTKDNNPDIFIVTETKVGGDRAKEITNKLPFDGAMHTDTIGYTGGLWLLWNSTVVEVEPIATMEQEIHAIIKVSSSNLTSLLSAVYASPRFHECTALWGNLEIVASNHNLPWNMMGDFNEVLLSNEKFGGHPANTKRALRFQECLDACNMIDMGFSGAKYTWSIYERAVASFTTKAKIWNKEVFGNIFSRKRKIEARLRGIQIALSNRPSQSLVDLENDLRGEYAEVFRIEEEFWFMKSRVEVPVNGDSNTSFYHTSTITRRIRNKIVNLRDGNGDWIGNDTDVAKHVRDGFIAFYTTEPISDQEIKNSIWSMKLFKALEPNGLQAGFFHRFWLLVSSSVIKAVQGVFHSGKVSKNLKKALISLIPKCSGADCLSSYKPISLCNTVYKAVSKVIVARLRPYLNYSKDKKQNCWPSGCGKVLKNLSKTLITLIPKRPGADYLSSYRPINLCNTVYKAVSKVIVARLRPYLTDLVSPMQTAFVPGSKCIDNIVIVQEILHSMSRNKGSSCQMTIKIDLEKAYDRLEWSFIRDTLALFKVPNFLLNVIMSCITSSSIVVLFNGGALEDFRPIRGIRQGNPLSPYVFIMCMEVLGFLIKDKCDSKLWNSVKAS